MCSGERCDALLRGRRSTGIDRDSTHLRALLVYELGIPDQRADARPNCDNVRLVNVVQEVAIAFLPSREEHRKHHGKYRASSSGENLSRRTFRKNRMRAKAEAISRWEKGAAENAHFARSETKRCEASTSGMTHKNPKVRNFFCKLLAVLKHCDLSLSARMSKSAHDGER